MQKSWEFCCFLWCFTIIVGYILQKYLWKDFVLFFNNSILFCIKYATEATLWRKYWWLHRILFKSWYIIITPLQAILFVFCYSRCYRYIVTVPFTSILVLRRCFESLRVCYTAWMFWFAFIGTYNTRSNITNSCFFFFYKITETDSHTVSRRAFLLRCFLDAKQWQKDVINSSHWP